MLESFKDYIFYYLEEDFVNIRIIRIKIYNLLFLIDGVIVNLYIYVLFVWLLVCYQRSGFEIFFFLGDVNYKMIVIMK